VDWRTDTKLVREFRNSGLSERVFAQNISVSSMTVIHWIRTSCLGATVYQSAKQIARHPG
jgi:hypothetical protein